MKKILLLGGSAQQIAAIEASKKLGYYTVLCDYLTDNPGQYVADKFYLVSTTDKEAVLEVAKKESIDGVLAYASDPAAPTAAYVAEKLQLIGNPYTAVETLCNKDKFRAFLAENGFNSPFSSGYSSVEDAIDDIGKFRFPVIIKPVDSSGSKGATVLHSTDDLKAALEFAFSFSRSGRVIIEEYIEKKHPYLIGGDIFVQNGRVTLWGLMNCHRDSNVNPLVPVGKSYPPDIDENDYNNIKSVLQSIVTKLHIESGAMNVELIVDSSNRVWPIDIGPRNGGNMIPDLLGYIFDTDIAQMTVKTAMGEDIQADINSPKSYYATYNLHSDCDGVLGGIEFSDEIEQYIIRKCIYRDIGTNVKRFDNAAKAIGIVFFKFPSKAEMLDKMNNMRHHIKIVLENGNVQSYE